jgi:hypothetical protein
VTALLNESSRRPTSLTINTAIASELTFRQPRDPRSEYPCPATQKLSQQILESSGLAPAGPKDAGMPVGRNNLPQKRNVFLSVRVVKAANDPLRKIAGYFVRLVHGITSHQQKTTRPV